MTITDLGIRIERNYLPGYNFSDDCKDRMDSIIRREAMTFKQDLEKAKQDIEKAKQDIEKLKKTNSISYYTFDCPSLQKKFWKQYLWCSNIFFRNFCRKVLFSKTDRVIEQELKIGKRPQDYFYFYKKYYSDCNHTRIMIAEEYLGEPDYETTYYDKDNKSDYFSDYANYFLFPHESYNYFMPGIQEEISRSFFDLSGGMISLKFRNVCAVSILDDHSLGWCSSWEDSCVFSYSTSDIEGFSTSSAIRMVRDVFYRHFGYLGVMIDDVKIGVLNDKFLKSYSYHPSYKDVCVAARDKGFRYYVLLEGKEILRCFNVIDNFIDFFPCEGYCPSMYGGLFTGVSFCLTDKFFCR